MVKNKKKGFTLVELIVAMAVSVIVLGMVASLSVLANKILKAQRYSSLTISEFESAKFEIETFVSKYSIGGYQIEKYESEDPESNFSAILIKEIEQQTNVAEIKFENGKLYFYEIAENGEGLEDGENGELQEKKLINFESINRFEFELSENIDLLKCVVGFTSKTDMRFFVNLGGFEIGY